MTKKILLATAALALGATAFAQNGNVGIGTTTPNADAKLDITATNKGLLLPRVALTGTANAAPLSAHVAGMTVYNTKDTLDVSKGTYYNNGIKWIKIGDAASAWSLTGNAGTTPGTNYLGTKDSNALVFKTNATNDTSRKMVIMPNGKVGIGTSSPASKLEVLGGAVFGNSSANFGIFEHTVIKSHAFNAFEGGLLFNNSAVNLDLAGNKSFKVSNISSGSNINTMRLKFGIVDNMTPNTFAVDNILTLTGIGNVGIGMLHPAGRLHIDGAFDGSTTIAQQINDVVVTNKGWLGIGLTNPTSPFHVRMITTDGNASANNFFIDNYQNSADPSVINQNYSRGTPDTPANLVNGDVVGGLWMVGRVNNSWGVLGTIAGTYTGDGTTNKYQINISNSAGFIRLADNGNVGIGTASPSSKLQVTGIPAYNNDAAAGAAGLTAGAFWQTASTNTIGLPAGVLMVKQ